MRLGNLANSEILEQMKRDKQIHKKNPNAVALGRLGGTARAKRMSSEQRSEAARKAGLARSEKLSAEERRRIAMLGVKARRQKRREDQ